MIEFLSLYGEYARDWWPEISAAIGVTLALTGISYILSIALGIVLALGRLSSVRPLRAISRGYIEIVRSVPALVILFLIYFALADFGLALDAFTAGAIGLALSHGAFMGEVFRGGLEALHKGQREAALAVGLSPNAAFRYILLPQALRIVLPPAVNMLIVLLRDSSLCYFITTPELMLRVRDLTSTYFLPLHLYLLAGAIYFAIGFPLSLIARKVERMMGRGRRAES